jgi:integrase
MLEHGILPDRVKDVPVIAIVLYVQHCLARGLTVASVRNIATEIRVVMDRAGADIDHVTNKFLGLARRNRDGRKRPPTDAEMHDITERARRADEGFYILIRLQRLLGLRRLEAMLSAPDLENWLELALQGADRFYVSRGTKGGRPRDVRLLEKKRAETIAVLREGVRYCQAHGGRLITGTRNDLRGSLERLKWIYRHVGLTREISSHSLRHAYAVERACEDLERNIPEETVLVNVSADLGHGPTRGQMTLRTYLLPVISLFSRIVKDGKLIGMPKYLVDKGLHRGRQRRHTTTQSRARRLTRHTSDSASPSQESTTQPSSHRQRF